MPWWHRLQIRGKKMSIFKLTIDENTTMGEFMRLRESAESGDEIEAAVCLSEFYSSLYANETENPDLKKCNFIQSKVFALFALQLLDLFDIELESDPTLYKDEPELVEHYAKIRKSLEIWSLAEMCRVG